MPDRRLNVLVLGVGGNVSQGIQKALSHADTPTRVVAACINAEAPGLYLAEVAVISPFAQESTFGPWLLDLCERERIDAVMSGSEIVLEALAIEAPRIQEDTGAVCIVSSPEVLRIGRDKLLTCRWLERKGLPVPGYADFADAEAVGDLVQRCGFPLIAKPRWGKGSDGILRVRDERDLMRVVGAEDISLRDTVGSPVGASDLILQEWLGDEHQEYTAGCFCDIEGNVRGTVAMRRTLRTGTTATAELGSFPEVRKTAEMVVAALRPLGPCNVQMRMHHGRAVPFEINPRFSGTTSLRARMGFNEVDAALRHFVLGEPAQMLEDIGTGVVLRYWNEVYVPRGVVDALERDGQLSGHLAHEATVEGWGRHQ